MKNRVKVYLIQAKQYAVEGKKEQALESIRKALAIDPGEMLITEVLLSIERSRDGDFQIENTELADTTVLQPNIERNNTTDMDSKLEKIFRLSEEARVSGNEAKALAYLKKGVQLYPDEPEAAQKLEQLKTSIKALNLVKIGLKKLAEGETEKAISASRKAFDLQPETEGLDELLARIEKLIKPEEEEEVVEETLEEEPDIEYNAESEESEDTEEEEEELEEEEDSPSGETLLWADRIRTAVQDDNFEGAGKMVSEAIRRHPDDELLNSFHSKLKRLGFTD